MMSNKLQKEYLSFNIQGQSFCINLEQIHEVILAPFITIVPTLGEFMEGIINYRGNIIEIFNLHRYLGNEHQITSFSKIIVYKTEKEVKGILIGEKVKIIQNFQAQFAFPELFKHNPHYPLIHRIFWNAQSLFYELNMKYPFFS